MTNFVVTDRSDVVDDNDTDLSLREALAEAAAHPGADTIAFDAAVFVPGSAVADRTIHLTAGELAIIQAGGPLTVDGDVDGDGRADVVINADAHSRVLNISGTAATAASVDLHGLVITGGHIVGDIASGGGLRAEHADLVLNQTTITGNQVDSADTTGQKNNRGGGLYLLDSNLLGDGVTISDNDIGSHGAASGGGLAAQDSTVELAHSSVLGNHSFGYGLSAAGGAIWISGGELGISDSGLLNNTAYSHGGRTLAGGIYAQNTIVTAARVNITNNNSSGDYDTGHGGGLFLSDSTTSIADSTVGGNRSASGGGVEASGGQLSIQGTTIRNNDGLASDQHFRYLSEGGGINTHGTSLTVEKSFILGNRGQGIAAFGGTTLVEGSRVAQNQGSGIEAGKLTVIDSTVDHNSAVLLDVRAVSGGGIHAGDLLLINSTVSDNTATASSVGNTLVGKGGGIEADNAEIRNSTIVGNVAEGGSGFDYYTHEPSTGGGIDAQTLVLSNSIVAGNVVLPIIFPNRVVPGIGPDIHAHSFTSNGHNIVSQHGIVGLDPGDLVVAQGEVLTTVLDPLGGYGGGRPTYALPEGSPAIDAGDTAAALDQNGHPLLTDERGFDRTQGGSVDIGAVESNPNRPLAHPDAVHATTAQGLTIDVLANDEPGAGARFVGTVIGDAPAYGHISHNADGSLDYEGDYGFHGTDRFDYLAVDSHGGVSARTQVSVTVDLPAGYDLITGTASNQTLTAGDHSAQIDGGTGDERLIGSRFADNLLGGGGDDQIFGGNGNDVLVGGTGTDTLWGGSGDNVLVGGHGADVLHGGPGADLFVLDRPAAEDRIFAFDPTAGDRVHLDIPAITNHDGSLIGDRLESFNSGGNDFVIGLNKLDGSFVALATLINVPDVHDLSQVLDNMIG